MMSRYNSVLNFMFNVITKEAPTDVESDLPGKIVNFTVIPCDILLTAGTGSVKTVKTDSPPQTIMSLRKEPSQG